MAAAKQGAHVLNCLRGEAWRAAEHLSLTAEDDNSILGAEGLGRVLETMTEAFGKPEKYMFETRRMPGETMIAYIAKFKAVMAIGANQGIEFPENIRAYLLLR